MLNKLLGASAMKDYEILEEPSRHAMYDKLVFTVPGRILHPTDDRIVVANNRHAAFGTLIAGAAKC